MIIVRGQYGFGDVIHQRAIVRDLMKTGETVVLETFYRALHQDLIEQGLHIVRIPGLEPRIRELDNRFSRLQIRIPANMPRHRIRYNKQTIEKHGSILAAQYSCVGLKMPDCPDFSFPVPDLWKDFAQQRLMRHTKPLLMFRPSTLNNLWRSEARAPDPESFRQIYEYIRDEFHVVSFCNLGNNDEVFDGWTPGSDQQFHHGELAFEELAGMFSVASISLTCAGFAPVLSQAVGCPTVIVYGGNEAFADTNSVGVHLAPTLPLEPIAPCACHLKEHDCDKRMDIPAAFRELRKFMYELELQQCVA